MFYWKGVRMCYIGRVLHCVVLEGCQNVFYWKSVGMWSIGGVLGCVILEGVL